MPAYLFANSSIPWLTLLLCTPLLGALLVGIGAALRLSDRAVRTGATLWSLIPIGIGVMIYAGFDPRAVRDGQQVVQFVERIPWAQAIRVDYFLGVDGLSLPLILLTALMTPVAMAASFGITQRVRAHYALLFLLEAAMLGYFVALNFFFFFLFWEASLVPAFFLIQNWGRDERRRRAAAFTFFVYTLAGSLGMLLLFLLLYAATSTAGRGTFDLIELARLGQGLPVEGLSGDMAAIVANFFAAHAAGLGQNGMLAASVAFWSMFVAFAIKLAIWPFHTWLPDAYAEAPTAGTILLAAVMSKMGGYGMLRILLPLFPDAARAAAPLVGALAVIGVLAGALGALSNATGDLKRMLAYTSINHMGYVGLAVAAIAALPASDAQSRAIALNGALMQMVAHGLSTGALFLLAGTLYERAGTNHLAALGGLRRSMPTLAGAMGVAVFANLGLPGLAGFVGEFLILRGAWAAFPWLALAATLGLILTALALLRTYGQIFHGPAGMRATTDIAPLGRDMLAAAPLLIALIALGIYPAPILDLTNAAVALLARAATGS